MDSDTVGAIGSTPFTYEDDSNIHIPNLKPIPVTDLHLCCGVGINSNLTSPPTIPFDISKQFTPEYVASNPDEYQCQLVSGVQSQPILPIRIIPILCEDLETWAQYTCVDNDPMGRINYPVRVFCAATDGNQN
eukprot:891831_1